MVNFDTMKSHSTGGKDINVLSKAFEVAKEDSNYIAHIKQSHVKSDGKKVKSVGRKCKSMMKKVLTFKYYV